MLRKTRSWDIRCPTELHKFRDQLRGKPYYWKVSREQAQDIVNMLSKAYHIEPCKIMPETPPAQFGKIANCNGIYQCGCMWIWPRAHIKTVFHEFYHHLDFKTHHKYNSCDHIGGATSNAWKFADRLWNELTKKENTMKTSAKTNKKETNKKETRTRLNKDQKIHLVVKKNPFTAGSGRFDRFKNLKEGMTIADALKKIQKSGFLRFVIAKNIISLR